MVKVYKITNGQKVIIATSKLIHSVTTSKTHTNPLKVIVSAKIVNLILGEKAVITSKSILPKDKKIDYHTAEIRYESTNKNIAAVTNNGTITAKSKGICYVYAYAQNGVYAKIKVVIK